MPFGRTITLLTPRLAALPLLSIALCALCGWAAPARAQQADPGLDLRETLTGILAYTRWPQPPKPLRLCVIGQSPHVESLLQQGLTRTGQWPLPALRPRPELPLADQCDVLYVGEFDPDQWLRLLPSLAGRGVLTVCEHSPSCASGGMVRMQIDPAARHVRFEVNLDAVARSTVRIHPQVLKLGRRGTPKVMP